MKAKYFQTFDPLYHKKVKAINIILDPEEKERFEAGLVRVADLLETGERLKKFLREYKPYGEYEEASFPNGAYNTVIFENMFMAVAIDLVEMITITGLKDRLIEANDKLIKTMDKRIKTQAKAIDRYEQMLLRDPSVPASDTIPDTDDDA